MSNDKKSKETKIPYTRPVILKPDKKIKKCKNNL